MVSWELQGCPVCRQMWEAGQELPKLENNLTMRTSLHRCKVCGTYWDQDARGIAAAIPEHDARLRYTSAAFQKT